MVTQAILFRANRLTADQYFIQKHNTIYIARIRPSTVSSVFNRSVLFIRSYLSD